MPEEIEKLKEKNKLLREQNRKLRKEIRQLKKLKKVETSKVIFFTVTVITVAVTVFSCFMIWTTKDTSALAYLIPAVFAELAAATGFYYNKAKAENKIKLMAQYGVKPENTDFNTY